MIDQAADLRKLVGSPLSEKSGQEINRFSLHHRARVFSITSGKGGVGKTTLAVNLAYALQSYQKKALLVDADLGLGNVNILLGLVPKWTLDQVMHQEKSLAEVIITTDDHLSILPAGSGAEEMTNLSINQKLYLKSQLDLLDEQYDFLLLDTAAGITSQVMTFNQMAQEVIIVVTPDPASFADAYATVKVLAVKYGVRQFRVITNQAKNATEGQEIFRKLEKICRQFLKLPIYFLGSLSLDEKLVQSSRNQQIAVKEYPRTTVGKAILQMAERLCGIPYDPWSNKNINFLLTHVLNL